VFQIDLLWNEVAPTEPADAQDPNDPAYQWPAELTEAISQAARYHMSVCLLVQRTPAWANGGRSPEWEPTNVSDYANFLIAAARRYPTVHHWMIWGEPNRGGNFYPMPANSPVGPRAYALLLNAAYHALKQVDASNVVIGGDTWSFGVVEPADFLRWMRLPDGAPPPLDYYGHNPFSRRFPEAGLQPYFPGGRDIDDLATLESQLKSTYHRAVDLWLSEFTISSNHPNRAFNFAVSRPEQAKWITAAFSLVNSYRFVKGLGWFDLLDQAPPGPSALTNGLMTWNAQPKPAFYAYERAR
jgi:polysaccharide biosynthesis protein PslG